MRLIYLTLLLLLWKNINQFMLSVFNFVFLALFLKKSIEKVLVYCVYNKAALAHVHCCGFCSCWHLIDVSQKSNDHS